MAEICDSVMFVLIYIWVEKKFYSNLLRLILFFRQQNKQMNIYLIVTFSLYNKCKQSKKQV